MAGRPFTVWNRDKLLYTTVQLQHDYSTAIVGCSSAVAPSASSSGGNNVLPDKLAVEWHFCKKKSAYVFDKSEKNNIKIKKISLEAIWEPPL